MKKDFLSRTSLLSVLSIMILIVMTDSVCPVERGSNQLEIIISGGSISATLKDAPISNVLGAIERQTKILFLVDEAVAGEEITASFEEIPLEHALKQILNSLNYSLIYDQNNKLDKVIIFGKKGTFGNKMGGIPVSPQKVIEGVKKAEQESSPDDFEVLEDAPPSGRIMESTPVEDENFKVIKNVPSPGGPVEMTEEEQEQFKVIKDSPPPGD